MSAIVAKRRSCKIITNVRQNLLKNSHHAVDVGSNSSKGKRMSDTSFKFEKSKRSLWERLFEPPAVGKMSPVAKAISYIILIFWSAFVSFPIYWTVISTLQSYDTANTSPRFIPFVDFQPTLDAWRAMLSYDRWCDGYSFVRQVFLLVHNSVAYVLSPLVHIDPMERQICKLYQAFIDSIVIGICSTALCITIGSMAAYALARIQYKPKIGNIVMFVVLSLVVIGTSSFLGVPWYFSSSVALVLFFLLARSLGRHFTAIVGNGGILFWMISQRILPPMVVIIPNYIMFKSLGLLDTDLALIIIYAVSNLPIVVWLMHDFFSSLPIELEEAAQLDGATRFSIFWSIVLPLTRNGIAATALLSFVLDWNEYLFAAFLSTSNAQTLPVFAELWGESDVIMVMIIPVIIMAIILQRFIAKGVLIGAVKG